MSDDYCHLCDADPCWCGGNIQPAKTGSGTVRNRRDLEDAVIREYVLSAHHELGPAQWSGWLERINARFGDAVDHRPAWNRVSNQLHRDMVLISDPSGGPMMPPSHYPRIRRYSLEEAVTAIETLIAKGGWTADEPGLRLWMVWERIGDAIYIDIYDAMHEMNRRGHLITTTAPSGKQSQFWYVKADG